MTSVILIWHNSDKSDIKVASDEKGEPLLFEFKSNAVKYANSRYAPNGLITKDLPNCKVVEL